MTKSFLILVTLFFGLTSNAQGWPDTLARIEKIFSRYKAGIPGAQLSISRHGQQIFSKAWGMSDLEHGVPLTTTSLIEAGSVSKQFTAAAILLLEQEGKLSLNDPVRKYLPELPDYGKPITLRHMIQHVSGLKDWGSIAAIAGWPRSTKTYNNDDALYIVSLQKTLNNNPGDEYIYSNSNYNLLAVIVQRVSGMSLADYSKKKIFEPAGMTHTEWRADFRKVVPNRAIAYSKDETGYFTNMPNEYVYGNGGLLTTTEDLLKWNHYYLAGMLSGNGLLEKQLALTPLNNGRPNNYAAGLVVDKFRGWKQISHNGATAGYRSNLEHYPELGLSIAWLSNSSEFDRDTFDLTGAVTRLFVHAKEGDITTIEVVADVPVSPDMPSFSGWYRNPRSGSGTRLFVKNGELHGSDFGALRYLGKNVYAVGRNELHMKPGPKRSFLWISSSKDSILFDGVDSFAKQTEWNAYTGEYYSSEAEAKYKVVNKGGKLFLVQGPKEPYELKPTYRDGFTSPFGTVYFIRDKKNQVAGLRISVSRARNVAFDRVK
jgi:CubicO group peptidase (beta-lactamase class C family)